MLVEDIEGHRLTDQNPLGEEITVALPEESLSNEYENATKDNMYLILENDYKVKSHNYRRGFYLFAVVTDGKVITKDDIRKAKVRIIK